MHEVTTIAKARDFLDAARAGGRTVGLVPTMGYLHDGHLSLIERSSAERDVTMTTIFVNPLQFAPDEDLDAYPRDIERDRALAAEAGCDVLFVPETSEMYPDDPLTTVSVDRITADLEGASRPTHFAGVATVVAKLFNIAGPCHAYFGEKDFQQLAVVRRMAADLAFPVTVVGCPTVRELDGLAMSSRNVRLTADEREAAVVLSRALKAGAAAIASGNASSPAEVEDLMAGIIDAEPLARLDYAVARRASDLARIDRLAGTIRLLVAVGFDSARLIDNLGVEAP